MNHPLFDITGRVALVTGSSKGIGRAHAQGLLEAGAVVVLNARGQEALERTRDELAELTGGTVHAVAFDVTDGAAAAAGLERVAELAGPVDILVNNAGMQHRAPITEFTDEAWQALLQTNITSAFVMSRAVAPGMIERGRGKIVNICSVQTELARPGIAAYSATKGALKMLTRGLCADLAVHGIQVNGLAPGYFATELTSALVADKDFTAWVEKRTPAGRWGDVKDLVGTLVYLSSPASNFVNGQVVFVDGGMTSVL
ncbi:gluconate 5-dehydrogenase [Kineosphaera limosa]|uniref:Gluconate 5-dehydrogenase n=1 Tax=Kineosphaera limosa NBRC 100340 TaxID=1184609 RepID=K6VG04_9MICO|nr:SDR family NAD(P)-dependent oxidoreductase [Kineosphaera limosa]NYE02989.1 gluconate 5-dehydrogenase [Kineosphaera limosa]GAB95118.1 gluconate 5-dehydrogenase [Kineosphaera limosa NBRC 100340]